MGDAMTTWPFRDWATGYVTVLWGKRHWNPALRCQLRHWVKVARANRRA